MTRQVAVISFVLLLSSCSEDGGALFVDLRTDLVPGAEFFAVTTLLDEGTRVADRSATADQVYLEGRRVADFGEISAGAHIVEVRLLDAVGGLVAARRVRVRVAGNTPIQVLVSRGCADVTCASNESCVRGACVSEECHEELSPEACNDLECATAADCAPISAGCAAPTCELGTCLASPVPGACAADEYCDVEAGCVRRVTAAMDGGVDADASDGGADAPADTGSSTWPTGPFGEPIHLSELGPADDPTLTPDLLEIYVELGNDIYRSVRTSPTETFPGLTVVSELNFGRGATNPELSPNGLEIYVSYQLAPMEPSHIHRSTRATTDSPWSTPVIVSELQVSGTRAGLVTDESGRFGYLHQGVASGPRGWDLFRVTRPDTASPWEPAVLAVDLRTIFADISPFLRADGLMILYESGELTADTRIMMAERSTPTESFGTPVPLTELDEVDAEDGDPWVSPDGRTIFFYSNRSAGPGIYVATR